MSYIDDLKAVIQTCDCHTKTNDPDKHQDWCRFRVASRIIARKNEAVANLAHADEKIRELQSFIKEQATTLESAKANLRQWRENCGKLESALKVAKEKLKEALPWFMFYGQGKCLGDIARELGGTIYDYSPGIFKGLHREDPLFAHTTWQPYPEQKPAQGGFYLVAFKAGDIESAPYLISSGSFQHGRKDEIVYFAKQLKSPVKPSI